MRNNVIFCIGTRPDLIKMAPLIKEYSRRGRGFEVVHVGQHYDDNMDAVFMKQLGIPSGTRILSPEEVKGQTSSWFYARIFNRMFDYLKYRYDSPSVVVYGDTWGALACAAAAARTGRTRLIHLEAGLRSHDLTMPEECARIQIDGLSDVLFPPTQQHANTLAEEEVQGRRFVCGNLVVDALKMVEEKEPDFAPKTDFALMTMHRPENVDQRERLAAALSYIGEHVPTKIVWPMHPRATNSLKRFEITLSASKFQAVPAIGYAEMLWLLNRCSMVVTDSGGLQEESCILGKKCITIRKSTERPETIDAGSNVLVDVLTISGETKVVGSHKSSWKHPYGENVASKIADVFDKELM